MNFKVLFNVILIFDFLFVNNIFSEEVMGKKNSNVKNSFTDIVSLDIDAISYENFCSGCEVVSVVNLLNYFKYNVNLNDFYKNYFIHRDWISVEFENKKTKMIEEFIYGPHPDYAFPGDPRIASGDNCGFGCFKHAICDSINKFLREHYKNTKCKVKKYNAVFEEGIATDDAMSRFVKKGIPVLIWSTQPNDKNIPVEKISKTILKMRKSGGSGDWWFVNFPDFLKGKIYVWTRGEHCSLLIGESNECYKICDPFRGIIYVDKESLNESRKIFNNQIVYLEEQTTQQKQIEKVMEIVAKIKNGTSNKLD